MEDDTNIVGCLIGGAVIGLVAFVLVCMFVAPIYNIWNASQTGQATLAQANYESQTKIAEAKANLQAQQYNADAEIVRARGVASAMNIVKASLTDEYIRYLWVQTLDKLDKTTIIYIPTETGLPITEAPRLKP